MDTQHASLTQEPTWKFGDLSHIAAPVILQKQATQFNYMKFRVPIISGNTFMDHDLKGSSPERLNASLNGVVLDHTRTKLADCVGTDLPLLEANGVSAYENLFHIKYALAHAPPDSGNGTCATSLEANSGLLKSLSVTSSSTRASVSSFHI